MIAVTANDLSLIRWLPTDADSEFGFHKTFGFIGKKSAAARAGIRKRAGLSSPEEWLCRFQMKEEKGSVSVQALKNCEAKRETDGAWLLSTPVGAFKLTNEFALGHRGMTEDLHERSSRILSIITILGAFFIFLFPFWTMRDSTSLVDKGIDPNLIRRAEEVQKKVAVEPFKTKVVEPPKLMSKAEVKQKPGGAAVAQNLGFLSLLGKKDLRKVMGGMPSGMKDVTPGAGMGGKGGSGGELLVGLGQGVKPTTVGNTGVKGLGGIGDAPGAGGGAGGYGTSLIGSGGTGNSLNGIGNGRVLSNIPLSNDLVLEGGLDQAVIQATIAKYLSQIRACYEEGLRDVPGLTGQVTMNFEINAGGNLNFARVARSSLGNAGVERCISGTMMTWLFPKPLGGVQVKVSYPFLLRPTHS